jgi:serine/threonine protein kinase
MPNEASPHFHFHPETGLPITVEGEQIVARSWLEEAVPASGDNDVVHEHDFRVPYKILAEATHDFCEKMTIGGGGSCLVYKGNVYGVDVAIKALKEVQGSGAGADESKLSLEGKQFFAEMKLLQDVRHENICRLLAVSMDGSRRCLLLPLCSGGDLLHRIKKKDPSLTCPQRLQVILGILLALQHLHSVKMIHRDVKTQNVLLSRVDLDGEDMTALTKLADFGTVRDDVRHRKISNQATGTDNIRSHSSTKQVIGTRPYMSPEYHMLGQV